jgi:hypothetical protein
MHTVQGQEYSQHGMQNCWLAQEDGLLGDP